MRIFTAEKHKWSKHFENDNIVNIVDQIKMSRVPLWIEDCHLCMEGHLKIRLQYSPFNFGKVINVRQLLLTLYDIQKIKFAWSYLKINILTIRKSVLIDTQKCAKIKLLNILTTNAYEKKYQIYDLDFFSLFLKKQIYEFYQNNKIKCKIRIKPK